jgi:hypothetical protein
MKAQELRIGNWIQFRHTETPVRITLGDFVREYNNEHLEDYEPIPLTEEWLVKFGFEFDKGCSYWKSEIELTKDTMEEYFTAFDCRGFGLCEKEIKHVHQLQNLYFALTGEELTN